MNRVPSIPQAEAYLAEAAHMNPGQWVAHSRHVAQAAARLAASLPDTDPQAAHALGLLHDIGRREGVRGMIHILDGYRFLTAEGYPDAARVCLTHSFPNQSQPAGADAWDGTPEEFAFVHRTVQAYQYNRYDRLVQLCDALCMAEGPVLMEKRLFDVTLRYGANENTIGRWQAFIDLRQEIESALGTSIYRILPEALENSIR
jgi:hypothetical protein